jgi:hypothetical protein
MIKMGPLAHHEGYEVHEVKNMFSEPPLKIAVLG